MTEIAQGTLTIDDSSGAVMRGVSIDTRTLRRGELYIAIKGANHDGHSFLTEAGAGGAVGALIERDGIRHLPASLPAVVVRDSHQALIDLAIAHRKKLTGKTAGITGSVGKTTVKEMTRHLLQSAGVTVHASQGNLNNLYGLPLSLLRMDVDINYGVFELGVSTPGEMKRLAPILRPFVGAITNVSETHVEALGSLAGVRREKLTLLERLQPSGIAVVNSADIELLKGARAVCDNVLTFAVTAPERSTQTEADIIGSDVTLDPATGYVSFGFAGRRIELPAFGEEQVSNALCAFAICRALGVDVEMSSLETLSSESLALRGERRLIAGLDVIVDCYNANPSSMRAGLKTFALLEASQPAGKKIAVIGDMLELGVIESQEHLALGKYLASIVNTSGALDIVITVGKRARLIAEALRDSLDSAEGRSIAVHSVSSALEAGELLVDIAAKGDTVYLKASRGIALETALSVLSPSSESSASKGRSQV